MDAGGAARTPLERAHVAAYQSARPACPPWARRWPHLTIFSASMVAEEMMMRRSGRRRCTFFSRPSSMSVASERSCASSTMTTLYLRAAWGRAGQTHGQTTVSTGGAAGRGDGQSNNDQAEGVQQAPKGDWQAIPQQRGGKARAALQAGASKARRPGRRAAQTPGGGKASSKQQGQALTAARKSARADMRAGLVKGWTFPAGAHTGGQHPLEQQRVRHHLPQQYSVGTKADLGDALQQGRPADQQAPRALRGGGSAAGWRQCSACWLNMQRMTPCPTCPCLGRPARGGAREAVWQA